MLSSADRFEIYELLAQVGHLLDEGCPPGGTPDLSQLRTVYTADAEYDLSYRGLPVVRGIDAIIEHSEYSWSNDIWKEWVPLGTHTTNIVLTEEPDGTVRAKSKLICIVTGGRAVSCDYHDIVVRTSEGWRIKRRAADSRDPSRVNWTQQSVSTS